MSVQRFQELTDEQLDSVDTLCFHFEETLKTDRQLSIESQLAAAPVEIRDHLFAELLAAELEFHIARGGSPDTSARRRP